MFLQIILQFLRLTAKKLCAEFWTLLINYIIDCCVYLNRYILIIYCGVRKVICGKMLGVNVMATIMGARRGGGQE